MTSSAPMSRARYAAREDVPEMPPVQPRRGGPGLPGPRNTSPEAFAKQAFALDAIGDHHRARLLWMEVARKGDVRLLRQFRVLRRLGKEALARQDHEQAVVLFEQHLALTPHDPGASDRLLEACLALAAAPMREAVYGAHVARFGESAATLILRAVAIDLARGSALAQASLKQAEALAPKTMRLRLARAYEHIGDPSKALDLLDALASGEAASPKAVRAKLRLLRTKGGPKETSAEIALRLIAAEPNVAQHHALLGRILRRYNDWAGAAGAFERALGLDRREVTSWEGALRCYGALERDERIGEGLTEARRLFADEGCEGLVSLARIELAGGCAQEAIEAARRAMVNPIVRSRARPVLAEALIEAGAYVEAWQHLETILQAPSVDLDMRRSAVRCASAFAMAPAVDGALPCFPDALFARALRTPLDCPVLAPTDTVVLVTSSLGAGGAERQVALTAAGISLARAGGERRTVLAGLDLSPARGRAMMRGLAETEHLLIEDLAPVKEGEVFRTLAAEDPRLRPALRLMASFPRALARDIIRLYDCFRRHRPSVVHLWQDGVISTGAVAATLAGVPTIVCSMRNVVAGEGDRRRYRSYLATMYGALAECPSVRFTANSAAGARDYEAWLGFEAGSIRVLRNGVDVRSIRARTSPLERQAVRERLRVPDDALLIGGVFRLAPAKRPLLWLDVVSQVAATNPRVHGVIVGDGAMRAEIEEAIALRGLTARITLAGRQSPVEPWMSAMDALLLASEVEGLPNVLLEAEALGVPVITTEAGGSGEALIDGVTGLLVKDDSPRTLAAALTHVMGSGKIRHRARVGAPVFIEQRFGLERMIRETLAVFGTTDPAMMEINP